MVTALFSPGGTYDQNGHRINARRRDRRAEPGVNGSEVSCFGFALCQWAYLVDPSKLNQ